MAAQIPEEFLDLLQNPYALTFGTVEADNRPHLTVLWFKWDGEQVLLSTTEERKKTANIRQNPNVSLMIVDPQNMYRYLEIRGTAQITQVGEEAAYDLIDELARMYRGVEQYYGQMAPKEARDKETRLIVRVTPEHVVTNG